MIALTNLQLALLVAFGLLYIVTVIRVARWARRTGRNPVLWFFITLLFTAIPAAVVGVIAQLQHQVSAYRGSAGRPGGRPAPQQRPQPPARCPHCQHLLPAEMDQAGPVSTCPYCRQRLDGERLA